MHVTNEFTSDKWKQNKFSKEIPPVGIEPGASFYLLWCPAYCAKMTCVTWEIFKFVSCNIHLLDKAWLHKGVKDPDWQPNVNLTQSWRQQSRPQEVLDSIPIRGFHKLSAIQECQYGDLCFICAIWNLLDHWSVQPLNVILLYPMISNFVFTNTIWLE